MGHESSVSIEQGAGSIQPDVVARLEEFLRLLTAGDILVPDPVSTRELAELARDEAAQRDPRWQTVRSLLTAIAAGLPSVSALTSIIDNVQTLIAHTAR